MPDHHYHNRLRVKVELIVRSQRVMLWVAGEMVYSVWLRICINHLIITKDKARYHLIIIIITTQTGENLKVPIALQVEAVWAHPWTRLLTLIISQSELHLLPAMGHPLLVVRTARWTGVRLNANATSLWINSSNLPKWRIRTIQITRQKIASWSIYQHNNPKRICSC